MQDFKVKAVEAEEPKSKQEIEAAVLDAAVEKGEIAPEYGVEQDGVIKINLDEPLKPKEDEAPIEGSSDPDGVVEQPADATTDTKQEEVSKEPQAQEPESALELVTEDETHVEAAKATTEQAKQALPQETPIQRELPENVDKLVKFMEDTGGTVEDYVNLNKDFSQMSEDALIRQYYRDKNPQMSEERLNRKMNKSFNFDEELDDPDDIQDKKDKFEDELFASKKYLEGRKEKYYADLKLSHQRDVDPQTREAVELYQQQKKQAEINQQLTQTFQERTAQVFNPEFKGFDFKVGENKYRVKVNDAEKVKSTQLDLTNFIQKFQGEDGTITDAAGYHKAIYVANNADMIANHFYEQGRADAIKEKTAHSKGINMDPRSAQSSDNERPTGTKVRAVDSGDSTKLRFKNYKNR